MNFIGFSGSLSCVTFAYWQMNVMSCNDHC